MTKEFQEQRQRKNFNARKENWYKDGVKRAIILDNKSDNFR